MLPYNITPATAKLDSNIEFYGHFDLRDPHGVVLLGIGHLCAEATDVTGSQRFHAFIEIWDVRDPDRPYHITTAFVRNEDADDQHFGFYEVGRVVMERVNNLGSALLDLPAMPGEVVRALTIEEFVGSLPPVIQFLVKNTVPKWGDDGLSDEAFHDFVNSLDMSDLEED